MTLARAIFQTAKTSVDDLGRKEYLWLFLLQSLNSSKKSRPSVTLNSMSESGGECH
jgi:hypothetical protein